jgi:predicted translin family RNA/ssDNA-binding protein
LLDKKDLERIQADLEDYDIAREKVFEASRSATRLSGWAIVQVHRQETKAVEITLKRAKTILTGLDKLLDKHSELSSAPSLIVAFQEYTEARLLHAIVSNGKLLSQKQVGVDVLPYLLGLLDFTGELRRMALNHLRKGEARKAEKTLALMEAVYEDLYSLDHTAIIPTFRHKMDITRKLIESTRGDVVTETRRLSLENTIKDLKNVLTKTKGLKLDQSTFKSSNP